jgi:sigma-B regulation protein RsbU (phosphoserine phosphatase)
MIRAFLVDDEQPARDRLKRLLAEMPGVTIVGEACDGEEALREIPRVAPDLVFLDIQMPGLTGMEVAATLPPPRPRIIFCTAFDQYAIQAFENHAVDYLLKPLNRDRLAGAVERIGSMVESGERMQREILTASKTQAGLFPAGFRPTERLEVGGVCRPARQVGGDYYDFLPLGDGRIALAVGDVSGKGLFAGLLMAGLQGRLQALARRYPDDLAGLFDELNRAMHAITGSNRYATLFYGVFDERTRRLDYVNAGHPAPLWLHGETGTHPGVSGTSTLDPTGTVVGLLPEARFAKATVQLHSGDHLLIFSDGLIETRGLQGMELGARGVEGAARECLEAGVDQIRDRILAEADRLRDGSEPEDDVTLVVVRVL